MTFTPPQQAVRQPLTRLFRRLRHLALRQTPPRQPSARSGALLTVLAAGFAPLVLLQTSLNLYVGNAFLLVGGRASLGVLALLCACLWGGLACALASRRLPGRIVWGLFTGYTLFFVVRDAVFPFQLNLLDGNTPFLPPRKRYLFLEMATLAASLGLALLVPLRRAAAAAGICAAVFAASTLNVAVKHRALLVPHAARSASDPSADGLVPTGGDASDKPDIYHLLFDGYQTVEYEWMRRERGLAPFDDFILFKDNIANHNVTRFSVQSLFTGTVYPPASDWRGWQDKSLATGLVPVLKQHGYRARIYGVVPHTCPTCLSDQPSIGVKEIQDRESRQQVLGDDFQLILQMRCLPSFLAVKCWEKRTRRTTPAPTDYAFYSVRQFNDMVDGIKNSQAGGNYTHVHLICPHPPCVLDEEGNYVGEAKGSRIAQVRLVDRLVGKLIAELKRLGRYDRSVIVVHSDHGVSCVLDLKEQGLEDDGKVLRRYPTKGPWSREWYHQALHRELYVLARAQALLLLKPAGHHGSWVSRAPAQLADLPATLLGMLGLRASREHFPDGVDLLAAPPPPDRLRKFFVWPYWVTPAGTPLVVAEYEFRNGRPVRTKLGNHPLYGEP